LNINSLNNSNFNKDLPVKIIIHGFNSRIEVPWVHVLKDAILSVVRELFFCSLLKSLKVIEEIS
jgi:hypothetical protein